VRSTGAVLPSRLTRLAAPAAVAAGAALLGASVGGLASVDGELRAAAPVRGTTTELVVLRDDRHVRPLDDGRCDRDLGRERLALDVRPL
jgi:hypothetical protein